MTDTFPDTFLRDEEVTRVTGVPRSTRYELIGQGKFPKPIKLSERMVAWSAAEIAAWQKQRIAARDGCQSRERKSSTPRVETRRQTAA